MGDAMKLILCLAVAAVIVALIGHALSAPSCLTKSEARKAWPRAHLYWHTSDRCWDNQRGGNRYPPRQHRDPVFLSHAEAKKEDQNQIKTVPTVMFPNVKQIIPWLDPGVYQPKESTLSYRLLDIDELMSRSPDPPECCWPELNPDGSLK